MLDWNVVVTTRTGEFARARELLRELGAVEGSDYYNVLVMRVSDVDAFLDQLATELAADPRLSRAVAHIRPARCGIDFQSAAEFEAGARQAVLRWVPALASRSFHVRMHRRGFKGRLSTPEEERFLDEHLLDALAAAGTPGRISFEDPDAILAVDTVSNRAGLALWSRGELRRYPFLGLD